MRRALIALAAFALAACGGAPVYTSTTVDPVDYRQQERDRALEEGLEGVDTSELAILEIRKGLRGRACRTGRV
jgi:hypothetical protein